MNPTSDYDDLFPPCDFGPRVVTGDFEPVDKPDDHEADELQPVIVNVK